MKTFDQLCGFLRGRRFANRSWTFDELDAFYPFCVRRGTTITLSSGVKHTFTHDRVFETVKELSQYIVKQGRPEWANTSW